jgi:hypothetical protein
MVEGECGLPPFCPTVAFHAVARDAVRRAHDSADVEALYAIADRQGWLVGETLEHARSPRCSANWQGRGANAPARLRLVGRW